MVFYENNQLKGIHTLLLESFETLCVKVDLPKKFTRFPKDKKCVGWGELFYPWVRVIRIHKNYLDITSFGTGNYLAITSYIYI